MKKRFLLTSALMLLLTVLALTSATYAWFTMSNTNKINDFTITTVSTSGGLEISLDGQRFSSTDVTIANPALNALDVTSADGIKFYKKESWNAGMTNVATLQDAVANTDYFEYKFYFKTTNAGEITLDLSKSYIVPASLKDSYVSAVDGSIVDPALLVTGNVNSSALGNFTRDWIAAAVKVSFMVTGYQCSDLDQYTTSARETVANFNKVLGTNFDRVALAQDQVSSAWSISKSNSRTYNIYDTTTNAQSQRVLDTTKTVSYSFELDNPTRQNEKVVIAQIGDDWNSGLDNVAYQTGKNCIVEVTMRIWIEGQDLEAKIPLSQGKFTSSFKFDFTEHAAADRKIVAVSGLNYVYKLDPVSGEAVTPAVALGVEWDQLTQGIASAAIYAKNGETPLKTLTVTEGAVSDTSWAFASEVNAPAAGDYELRVTLADGFVFADNTTSKTYGFGN